MPGVWLLLYAPTVNTDLWLASVTALGGVVLGGAISYVLSLQQIRAAQEQRLAGERSDEARRRLDRRFDVYADFLTHARRYRNAIRRPTHPESGPSLPLNEIDDLGRAADAAGSLVFLVNESSETREACGLLMRTMGNTSGVLHASEADMTGVRWDELNEDMSQALRKFQAAARAELGVDRAGAQTSDP
jgi:hypothetical protein